MLWCQEDLWVGNTNPHIPIFLPGKFQGQKNAVEGSSVTKNWTQLSALSTAHISVSNCFKCKLKINTQSKDRGAGMDKNKAHLCAVSEACFTSDLIKGR